MEDLSPSQNRTIYWKSAVHSAAEIAGEKKPQYWVRSTYMESPEGDLVYYGSSMLELTGIKEKAPEVPNTGAQADRRLGGDNSLMVPRMPHSPLYDSSLYEWDFSSQ